MSQKIELDTAEKERLNRILSCPDLERQKKITFPFFILAVIMPIAFPFIFGFKLEVIVLSLFGAFMLFLVGMARLGYYKLFRMIKYLAQKAEQNSPADAGQ